MSKQNCSSGLKLYQEEHTGASELGDHSHVGQVVQEAVMEAGLHYNEAMNKM